MVDSLFVPCLFDSIIMCSDTSVSVYIYIYIYTDRGLHYMFLLPSRFEFTLYKVSFFILRFSFEGNRVCFVGLSVFAVFLYFDISSAASW